MLVLKTLPQMVQLAQRTNPPYIFGISDRGTVERLDTGR